jgi:CheY-like chemotaxis protein
VRCHSGTDGAPTSSRRQAFAWIRCTPADAGYTVLKASNGRAALELLRSYQERPDVVIIDVGMPGMDGNELVRCLGEERLRLPIVLMSGYEVAIDPTHAFLQKPFAPDVLVRKVGEVLAANDRSE